MRNRPDFFIHCGDNIYADCPIAAEQKLSDGEVWRNIVTEEKSKPAETLAEYRGNYKYNLLDDNLRAFNAAVPTLALWDNHEVMETWWPDEPLPHEPAGEKNTLVFAARARRAFHEYMPMRETMAEPGRVYRKMPTARCSTCSCSTCAATAAPTGRMTTASIGPTIISSVRTRSPGSSASWRAPRRHGR